jgi:putative flippase GtrA
VILKSRHYRLDEHTVPKGARVAVIKKAIAFGVVGIINTLVDLCMFWIALVPVGLPLIPANAVAWGCFSSALASAA